MSEYRVAIDEPKQEMVRCVARECGREVPKHEAWRVTVEVREPIPPGEPARFTGGIGGTSPWSRSVTAWSTAHQALLVAAAPQIIGPVHMPRPTHVIYTYVGYGCSDEHAGIGSVELDHEA